MISSQGSHCASLGASVVTDQNEKVVTRARKTERKAQAHAHMYPIWYPSPNASSRIIKKKWALAVSSGSSSEGMQHLVHHNQDHVMTHE